MFAPSLSRPAVCAVGAASLAIASGAYGACTGPGAPSNTETKCLTAVQIPGNPLRSFDISFVNPHRAEFYFADRSNKAVQVIDTQHLTWKRSLGGFVGILPTTGPANNNISGPDGVVTHGRWVYAGDGDSTVKVFDLESAASTAAQPPLSTGGTTRVDEMDITSDGELLLAANNAEDPPFGTLFAANGDRGFSAVSKISKITIDPAIVPAGAGLSIEQPAWEPKTQRFYVSVPVIKDNPTGCNYGQAAGPITCHGGLLVVDPIAVINAHAATVVIGAYNPATHSGVVKLNACGPNGATVGPRANLLLGCTPQNNPADTSTLVINAKSPVNSLNVGGITGSDEVWYNSGDRRYYLGASRACGSGFVTSGGACPKGGAVLGVVDAETNLLIEKIPQGSNSHSVAADSKRNRIFVPQTAPASVVLGGDGTTVGEQICGSTNGCVAVYAHHVDRDGDRDDDDEHGDHDR
jgi:hypothetical protein